MAKGQKKEKAEKTPHLLLRGRGEAALLGALHVVAFHPIRSCV